MPRPALLRTALSTAALLGLSSCGGSDGPTEPGPDDVATVTVSPASATVGVGETVQLSVTATTASGAPVNASVTWTSTSQSVATVSSGGLVTGVGPGTTSVTASVGGRSGSASVTVTDLPPEAPSGLAVAPVSDVEMEVSWTDGSDNEDRFEIERRPVAGGGSFERVGTAGAGATSFRDTGLQPATAYRYRVRAANEVGASPYTASAEATTWATLAIESSVLRDGFVDEPYEEALVASGGAGPGTFTWTVQSGSLPPGIELSEEGVLSGTPTQTGTSSFQIGVTSGGQTVGAGYELAVREELVAPQVVTTALPTALVSQSYSASLEASGGDGVYDWAVISGTLPDGLELSGDGTVSGTPTTEGESTVTVQVSSAGLTGTGQVTLEVILQNLEVTTTTLPNAEVGAGYEATLEVTGGVGSVSWSVVAGTLPSGISLAQDGTLSGTPSVAGSSTFTVRATSGPLEDTAELDLVVDPGAVSVVTGDLDGGQVGTAYSLALQATGGDGVDYGWTVVSGSPPPGVSLDVEGTLSGTPTAEGTFSFRVRATSGGRSAARTLILTTIPQPQAGYQIELIYLDPVSSSVRQVFEVAKDRWSELITADEPDEPGGLEACPGGHPATQAVIDDMVIYVKVEDLDGEGGTLARAGPCIARDVSIKVLSGVMTLDETDVPFLESNDLLDRVILHEMGHVLGIGVLWDFLGLLQGECTVDPIFTGAGAIEAFNDADGVLYSGQPVPVEDEGEERDGSNCSHWRESVFGNELMSPAISLGQNPLSAVTVESLGDMGYTVDASKADAYTLPKPVPVGAAALRSGILLRNDILRLPLRTVSEGRAAGGRR